MQKTGYIVRSVLLAGALACAMLGTACAHHYYRVYDSYYGDYHVWNHDEVAYYNQWAVETRHDPHRDFRHLPTDEQKQYWQWRHGHGEHH